jgi:hypothetical protein
MAGINAWVACSLGGGVVGRHFGGTVGLGIGGGLVVGLLVGAAFGVEVDSLVGYWMVAGLEGHLGCNCW